MGSTWCFLKLQLLVFIFDFGGGFGRCRFFGGFYLRCRLRIWKEKCGIDMIISATFCWWSWIFHFVDILGRCRFQCEIVMFFKLIIVPGWTFIGHKMIHWFYLNTCCWGIFWFSSFGLVLHSWIVFDFGALVWKMQHNSWFSFWGCGHVY